jgi:hypothetical protein
LDKRAVSSTLLGFATAAILYLIFIMQAPTFDGFAIVARDSSIVLSDSDIISYSASLHEFTLTSACAKRLEARDLLEGPFTILINGNAELRGVFVPSVISRSYPSDQVVITYPSFDLNYGTMKIQMGYPWALPGTPDVDDLALVAYFSSTSRLAP